MSIVKLKQLGKPVIFGVGATEYMYLQIRKINPYKIGLIADEKVAEIYSSKLDEIIESLNIDFLEKVNSGDESKNIYNAIRLWKKMILQGFTRKSMLISFGGGVIGDLVSFIASTYMRGIYFVNIPTTLIAQADAAIGGKNGINLGGKNIIGTFYIASLTVIDPIYILTLSDRQFINGISEIIKHGIIASPYIIQYLENNVNNLIVREKNVIEKLTFESIKTKLDIISKDPFEEKHRMILNFGHTIGHAIEVLSGYSILHGEAVSQGIIVNMKLGKDIFGFTGSDRIAKLMKRLGLPTKVCFKPNEILSRIRNDKKAWYGKHILIIPRKIGEVKIMRIEEEDLKNVLGELYEDMPLCNSR